MQKRAQLGRGTERITRVDEERLNEPEHDLDQFVHVGVRPSVCCPIDGEVIHDHASYGDGPGGGHFGGELRVLGPGEQQTEAAMLA
ncbi:hypothetical protein HNC20_16310 [Rhodococcus rhodochrous]|uniref:hypothetical protein n=1 Tax=Rhodococcus rhodochrous TaxID=1829 RepID=UPI0009B9E3C8|nr:hypothetical protein [Rhodococcus rhodochrous]MDO1485509.1 hypothetical protein [Rhodococcus rhodochrous]